MPNPNGGKLFLGSGRRLRGGGASHSNDLEKTLGYFPIPQRVRLSEMQVKEKERH